MHNTHTHSYSAYIGKSNTRSSAYTDWNIVVVLGYKAAVPLK